MNATQRTLVEPGNLVHEMRLHAIEEAAAELERFDRHAAMAAAGISIQTKIDGSPVPAGTPAAPAATIRGRVRWETVPAGLSVGAVEYRVDANTKHPTGVLPLWTEHITPYQFDGDPAGVLDTRLLPDGLHKLGVRVYDTATALRGSQACWVTVDNRTPPPPPPPPPPGGVTAGLLRFCMYATSQADGYMLRPPPTAAQQAQMAALWKRAIIYMDQIASWFKNGLGYHDLIAIYNPSVLATQHPDWILRDKDGKMVGIPWGCSGGVCPQWLADPGNPDYRSHVLQVVQDHVAKGYRGVFFDDVNMPGISATSPPLDPRTPGVQMTIANWRKYVAELTEMARVAAPRPFEIAHNALWWASPGDPFVARQIKAADYFNFERGFNDPNYSATSIQQVLSFVDQLHAWGVGAIHLSYASTEPAALFNLACALLASAGGDFEYSSYRWQPDNFWAEYGLDLGDAKGARYVDAAGHLRRDFAKGFVTADAVAKTATINPTP